MNLVQGIYAFCSGTCFWDMLPESAERFFLPILLHLCFNFAGTFLAAWLSGKSGWLMQSVLMVIGVLMLAGAFFSWFKKRNKKYLVEQKAESQADESLDVNL